MPIASGQITISDLNDATSCYLSNTAVTLSCDVDGSNAVLDGNTNKTTVVMIYAGASVTPVLGTLVATNCAASKSGATVTITAVNASDDSGYVDIPVSYNSVSYGTLRLTWSKAKRGVSSVSLKLNTPDGSTFQGNVGLAKTVEVLVLDGETDVTTTATTRWFFNGVEQMGLSNLKSLEVYPADVTGSLTIKVLATYNGIAYQDSVTFLDLDDVYQVSIQGADKLKNSQGTIDLTAIVFRGSAQITEGFRCRWTNIGTTPATVIYEGINTTGTLAERGVTISLTPDQINSKLDLLCELSVDSVEQSLSVVEEKFIPSYDSRTYATAMGIALS